MKGQFKRASAWLMLLVMLFVAVSPAALAEGAASDSVSLSGLQVYPEVFAAARATGATIPVSNFKFEYEQLDGSYLEGEAPNGITEVSSGALKDSMSPTVTVDGRKYTYELAYVDDTSNPVADVASHNGVIYYRAVGGNVAGVQLGDKKIVVRYVRAYATYQVTYNYAATLEDETKHGTFTGADQVREGSTLEFIYTPTKYIDSSYTITAKVGDGEETTLTLKDGKYTLPNVTGDVVITANEALKTTYTLKLTGSNTAYRTTGSWGKLENYSGSSDNSVPVSMNCSSAALELHGRFQWSSRTKALNKVAITLNGNTYNLDIPEEGQSTTRTIEGITFALAAGSSANTEPGTGVNESSYRSTACSTPTYTVTITNCYEDIDIDVNFQDSQDREIWLLTLDGVDPIYSASAITGDGWQNTDKHVWSTSGTNYINNKNFGGEMTFYVRVQAGYEFIGTGDGVTVQASNGSTVKTIEQIVLTPTTEKEGYTHKFTINTSGWNDLDSAGTEKDKYGLTQAYYRWTIMLKATPIQYTAYGVHYELDGGAPEIPNQTVEGDYFTVTPVIPTKAGYVFDDWIVTKEDGTTDTVAAGSLQKISGFKTALLPDSGDDKTAYVTLKARWVPLDSNEAPYTIAVNVWNEKGEKTTILIPEKANIGNKLGVVSSELQRELDRGTSGIDLNDYQLDDSTPLASDEYIVNEDGTLVITLNYWKEITINYAVAGEGGTVTPTSETFNTRDNILAGSTAAANEGYEFDGWYTDAACTVKVPDAWIENNKLTPAMPADGWPASTTYYAKFKPTTTTVTVTKIVEGSFGDKNRSFNFSYFWKMKEDDVPDTIFYFSLKDGWEHVIQNVPIGAILTISEIDTDLTNYTTYFSVNDGAKVQASQPRAYAFTVGANDRVVVTNVYDVVPDTGVILDSLPYILILALVALGAAGVVIRRRSHRDDD